MASFSCEGLDELLNVYDSIADLRGEVVDAMAIAGGEELLKGWKSEIPDAGHVDTGQMLRGVKRSRPKKSKDSVVVEVYPQRKDKKGVRNALKAFVLHYGRKKTGKPHSTPLTGSRFIDRIVITSEKPAQDRAEAVWNDYLTQKGL